MLDPAALTALLPALPRILLAGAFWRTVPNEYLQGPPPGAPAGTAPQPLWPGGAAMHGARYTRRGGSRMLYLATDAASALAEVESVYFDADGVPGPGAPHNPLTVLAVQVRAPAVLDLCDENIQRRLGSSETELKAPWLRTQERHVLGRGPLPPTQVLGEAACASGTLLGLRYPSHRRRGVWNLVIFADRLAALGGVVDLVDTSGTFSQSLP